MTISWDWRAEGFAAPPALVFAKGDERLYRAWSDPMSISGQRARVGVCFSFDRARTRSEAERFYSIAEWKNAFWRLTIFEVPPGTPMWVGRVDPGDYCDPSLHDSRSQVFVQNPHAMKLRPLETVALDHDLRKTWVYAAGRNVGDRAPEEKWDQVWDD